MAGAAALIEFLGKGECKSRKYSVMLGEAEVEIARGGAWSLEIMSALIMDGSSQKAKQKRLISIISLFSLVFKRRATGQEAPS